MGKRGPKPKRIISDVWNANLAYAVGLIATDGCLSGDGRHFTFVSKDIEQINNFNKCLKIIPKIGKSKSGYNDKSFYRVQIGNVEFCNFLLSIGLMPAKSKIIGKIKIPEKYFFDFLRGCHDGDGTFYSYWDPRWRSSHMFYLEFISASKKHIDWLQTVLKEKLNVKGHITKDGKGSTYQLKYAKKEALEIIKKMYYNPKVVCLSRKRIKIEKALRIEKQQQKLYKK